MLPIKDDIATRRFPVLTVAIILICCGVYFLFEQGLWGLGAIGNERVLEFGAIPYEITHPGKECADTAGQIVCEGQPGVVGSAPGQAPWWVTIFTSMFMHGSLLHLGGNMLFLWIFGNNIEDSMGEFRFVAFYLLGGLAAVGAQVLVDPSAAVPTVGASGAIAAVLGGYAVLYPRARVITVVFIVILFTIIELPALLVLGFWILMQLFLGASDLGSQTAGGGGGVAYFAHIGGFLFGVIAIKLFADRVHEDYERAHRLPVY
ncbi:MAG: rhomboid family intramembrane serine protease [Thermoleophilaceae bacterium]|nr:rhomboid family intramembrane serine protease [Thermoleophilaceae bacterium]